MRLIKIVVSVSNVEGIVRNGVGLESGNEIRVGVRVRLKVRVKVRVGVRARVRARVRVRVRIRVRVKVTVNTCKSYGQDAR